MIALKKIRSALSRSKAAAPAPLIFLHIPRTGGTTMRGVLDQVYGPKACLNLPDFADRARIDERLDGFRAKRGTLPAVLSGHMNFGLHEITGGRYLTILRHPVERTVSTYYFARKREFKVVRHQNGDFVSLDEFIEPTSRGHGLVNMQSKMIAGLYAPVRRTWDFSPPPDEPPQPANLHDKALANLDLIETVGVTEQYDRSLNRFAAVFGWPAVDAEVTNAAERSSRDIPASTRSRIEQINAVDMELYERAITALMS